MQDNGNGADPGAPSDRPMHLPVLLDRVTDLLAPAVPTSQQPVFVDATLGLGGHAAALLEQFPQLHLIGVDRDPRALELARKRLAPHGERVSFAHAVYDQLPDVLADLEIPRVHGILLDLGVSSMQLDLAERGFAYSRDVPLDMRMDPSRGQTAADVLNTYTAPELARILRKYGEERFASRIADAVVRARAEEPFRDSARLVALLHDVVPKAAQRTGGHPAKRTFQALRVEVNDELAALERALPAAVGSLAVGGRLVVLAYHSLEDRLVKRTFAQLARPDVPDRVPEVPPGHEPVVRMLTRGAEQATAAEAETNPRATSVRLRAVERISDRPPQTRGTPRNPDTRAPRTGAPR